MTKIFWSHVLISLLTAAICTAECPSSCQCYQQSGINSIFCLKTKLPEIPNYFDFDVKILNFTDNHLPNLTDTFRNQHYKSLEILDLSRNSIANVDELALYQLKNLLEIDLSNNYIQFVPAKLFDNNRFLNTIHLRGNPIEELVDYGFSPSIYLRRLNFQGCRINKIHKFAFVNIPLLEYLNLRDNNLKALSTKALHFTPQMSNLLLDGNPWHCDKKLWHLLKWMQSRNMANSSLLCIYGETEDAILWDTMDVNNALKFRDTKVPDNVKRIRWSGGVIRNRRARDSVADDLRSNHRELLSRRNRDLTFGYDPKSVDQDYPSLNPVDGDDSEEENKGDDTYEEGSEPKESKFFSSENDDYEDTEDDLQNRKNIPPQTTFNYNKNGDPKLTIRYDPAKLPKQTWQKGQKPPDLAHWTSHHNSFHQPNHADENSMRHSKLGPHKGVNSEDSPNSEMNSQETAMVGKSYFKVSVDYYTEKKEDPDQSPDEKDANGTNVERILTNDENSEEEGDGVNMKFMLMVIAVEFIMLAVLIFVLYKLWKSNRRGREMEVKSAPLNNNKNIKTNDVQSPGYKRYSLSDEDCIDLRKSNLDEAKFDSESGYLSYHRFNSVEGETCNDGMHYRRNPRDENDALSAYTNAELDSMNGNNRLDENESADRRMRRNSSMRSIGRRTKINLARRSYSDDIKHEGEDV